MPACWLSSPESGDPHLQARNTKWGESVFNAISLFGSGILHAVAAAAVVAYLIRNDRLRALTVAAASAGVILRNNALKVIFHRSAAARQLPFTRLPSVASQRRFPE